VTLAEALRLRTAVRLTPPETRPCVARPPPFSRTPAQDTRATESLAAAIGTTEGRLDILVNKAGSTQVIPHSDLRALDDEFHWQAMPPQD
jgi:hypothetical protein